MIKSLELDKMNLLPLREVEQLSCSGGAIPFLGALAIAAPVVGIYCGILAIAYYGGYGAHVAYDAIKG